MSASLLEDKRGVAAVTGGRRRELGGQGVGGGVWLSKSTPPPPPPSHQPLPPPANFVFPPLRRYFRWAAQLSLHLSSLVLPLFTFHLSPSLSLSLSSSVCFFFPSLPLLFSSSLRLRHCRGGCACGGRRDFFFFSLFFSPSLSVLLSELAYHLGRKHARTRARSFRRQSASS